MDVSGHLEIAIDRLVLHGFAGMDRAALGRAVEQELTRLLSASGLPPSFASGSDVPHMVTPPLKGETNTTPAALGAQIAASVYEGLGR
jgi:hypothetical protein